MNRFTDDIVASPLVIRRRNSNHGNALSFPKPKLADSSPSLRPARASGLCLPCSCRWGGFHTRRLRVSAEDALQQHPGRRQTILSPHLDDPLCDLWNNPGAGGFRAHSPPGRQRAVRRNPARLGGARGGRMRTRRCVVADERRADPAGVAASARAPSRSPRSLVLPVCERVRRRGAGRLGCSERPGG